MPYLDNGRVVIQKEQKRSRRKKRIKRRKKGIKRKREREEGQDDRVNKKGRNLIK
ncbi:MAG: hypothetical protein QF535_04880 [Anaerolineales bacterium]|nr:hypothetical protein [Anaerolineales bacterium]